MIKRKYFMSCKVAHNDNTGEYSWWNTNITTITWFKDEDLLIKARTMSLDVLQDKVKRKIAESDIEVLALNRI